MQKKGGRPYINVGLRFVTRGSIVIAHPNNIWLYPNQSLSPMPFPVRLH